MAGNIDMTEVATVGRTHEHTLVRCAEVEVAVLVLAEASHRSAFGIRREIAADVFAVIFQ